MSNHVVLPSMPPAMTFEVELVRLEKEPWGIEIAGDAPVKIKSVRSGTPAQTAGVQKGDVVIAINGINVCNSKHKDVIQLIKQSKQNLRLKLLPKEDYLSGSETDSPSYQAKPLEHNEKSIYKSKSSAHSNWWEGQDEEESEEDEEDVEFDPNFELNEDEELEKMKEIDLKMEALTVDKPLKNKNQKKNTTALEDLLEADKHRKLIPAEHVERMFVSTEDQRNFDEDWKQNGHFDGSFVGSKACVPGCFTGDNVIVEERWEGGYKKGNEVTGIRNRVKAGIQHYEYDLYASFAAPEDRNKVVIYTTTLGVDKKLVADCNRAVTIIRNVKVKWEERDIFNFEDHKDEFLIRKGLKAGDSLCGHLPAIYIDGQYVGGLDELQALADCGDLRVRLAEFEKLYERHKCPDCKGLGKLTCSHCNGKKVKRRNKFGKLKCGKCDTSGQIECKGCYIPSEGLMRI